MTNHHCGRESVTNATLEGEDLHTSGFYAMELGDERKIEGLYVEQLVYMQDVTEEVQAAFASGSTESDKVQKRKEKMDELKAKLKEQTGFETQVISFYNGGKFSLYGFKRFNDVRLVLAPETQLGFFGGDPDNFTYPRYNLDYTFFRVYENDKPLETENFFKFSQSGPALGEPVFIVGNPGTTNRLFTLAQLEFQRDVQYPITMELINGLVEVYANYIKKNPAKAYEMQDQLFSFQNSQKAYGGILGGLRDQILMAKKLDFERTFQAAIKSNPKLNAEYGMVWDSIASTRKELGGFVKVLQAANMNPMSFPQYYFVAKGALELANEIKKGPAEGETKLEGEALNSRIESLFGEDFDVIMNEEVLKFNQKYLTVLLGAEHPVVKALTGGKTGDAAFEHVVKTSPFVNKEALKALFAKGPDAVLALNNDPFVLYLNTVNNQLKTLQAQAKYINDRQAVYFDKLGRALFEVYGTSIPPDATFSLRIADGVVAGYQYNGTTAPAFTTFHGLYERYYSNNKTFPWSLPERWATPPADLDLSTPMNFVSTNDIIGGNSGSAVINKNAEVVGLAFDGNIESLPGQFIFDTTANRTVNVHSSGILETIGKVYKVKRIYEELRSGKLAN